MLSYTIELSPIGKGELRVWTGKAINVIDAIQIAKGSGFPSLYTAKIIDTKEVDSGKQEGNKS